MKFPLFTPAALRPVLAATLIGLLPVCSGLAVLYWQLQRSLQDDVHNAAAEAIRQVDLIIDQAAQSARRLMPLAGQACNTALQAIREEVTVEPYVRSANLVTNHQAYCSSFYGAYERPVEPGDYFNQHLLLRASNAVTPNGPSLVYRHYEHPHGVRTVIDGRTLSKALRLIEGHTIVVLQVDEAYLWSDGSIEGGEIPDHPEHHTLLVSDAYGYSMHGGLAPGRSAALFRQQAVSTLGGLLLLGVLTGGVCHWLYRRPRRAPDA